MRRTMKTPRFDITLIQWFDQGPEAFSWFLERNGKCIESGFAEFLDEGRVNAMHHWSEWFSYRVYVSVHTKEGAWQEVFKTGRD